MTRRQTLTVEYPDNYGPFQAGQTFHATRILSATTVERVPDRAELVIRLRINWPDTTALSDVIGENIIEALNARDVLGVADEPEVVAVEINRIVT